MKRLLLSSVILLLFSFSIIIFQISCKKEATAQTTNCSDMATVVATINFPSSAVPCSTGGGDNGFFLETPYTSPTTTYSFSHSYYADFRNVGNASQKVFTIQSVVTGTYTWAASINTSCGQPYRGVGTGSHTINVVGGQTYNITINASDFH